MVNEYCMIISVVLIVLGFIFKKSRILYLLQFLWVWVLVGFNCGGTDYAAYEVMYNSYSDISNVHSPEILYRFICYISNNLNMDIITMNAITSFVAFAIIFYIISRHTENKCMAASMFMVFPFIDNAIQKRFLLATAPIMMAFHFLLTSKNWVKNKILYILLCVLAAQFHTSMYFFLIFILVDFETVKINKKTVALAILVSFLVISYIPDILSNLFNSQKVYDYFYDETMRLDSPLKILAFCMIHIGFVYLISEAINKKELEESSKVRAIMNLSLIFLPFYMYNSAFFRIIRVLIILGYMESSKGVGLAYNKKNKYALIALIVYIIANFVFFYCISGQYGYDGLVRPIFEQNVVIQNIMETVI